jgi:hypothetical protein
LYRNWPITPVEDYNPCHSAGRTVKTGTGNKMYALRTHTR